LLLLHFLLVPGLGPSVRLFPLIAPSTDLTRYFHVLGRHPVDTVISSASHVQVFALHLLGHGCIHDSFLRSSLRFVDFRCQMGDVFRRQLHQFGNTLAISSNFLVLDSAVSETNDAETNGFHCAGNSGKKSELWLVRCGRKRRKVHQHIDEDFMSLIDCSSDWTGW